MPVHRQPPPHPRPERADGREPRKLRVLVVDDSAFFRQSISDMLKDSGRFEVIGRAGDGVDAMALMRGTMPDLITLDLEMPRMNGFSFLRWVMKSHPVPVLVVSSHDSHASVFHALELGAADFMAKPSHRASMEIFSLKEELCNKLELIATIGIDTLVRRSRLLAETVATRHLAVAGRVGPSQPSPVRLVVIGASTGGPPAIQAILRILPPTFPAPIIIVQHMPPIFTKHFADRLHHQCPLTVKEAESADLIEAGRVLVVPGHFHLTFQPSGGEVRARLTPKRDTDRYVPSIDVTLASAASIYTTGLLAVVLTGMGDDGKVGMMAVKTHGGQTIAESEETAAIFGMPKEAINAGVVDVVLPLPAIGPALVSRAIVTS